VVVLGGGPAGLGAAWKLSERGLAVDLLEAKREVGGLAGTMRRDGYLFDFGPHRFHTHNQALLADIRSLVGAELEERYRKTRVYFMNHYYDYPLRAANLFTSLPKSLAVLCFLDFMGTWARNRLSPRPDDSFETWVVNRFGRLLYNLYFGPYTAKVWGRDPRQLSASWAAQRVAVVDLWDLVLRLLHLRGGDNGFHHSEFKDLFYYPRSGVGTISQRMAERTAAKGGQIHLGARALAVHHRDGRVAWVECEQDGRPLLVRMLDPQPPAGVLAAASSLKFRAMIFLYLMIARERVTDDHWIYFPDPRVVFNRVSEMKNFTPDAAPPGHTSLTLEITCDLGDEVWQAPEDELYTRSLEGLVAAGLIRREEVVGHFFVRTPFAYPSYDLHYESNLARLAYHLSGLENLVVCGRQGLFRYINTDHAIEMGFAAAEEIASQQIGKRVGRVGQEQVYFG